MPELPEVEAARKLVEDCLVGKRIVSVCAVESGGGPRDGSFDDIIFENSSSAKDVENALAGRILLGSHRKGKQMWWSLSGEGKWPCFHFGMTGAMAIKLADNTTYNAKYQRVHMDASSWPPRFTKLRLVFEGGIEWVETDPRRLGRILLLDHDDTDDISGVPGATSAARKHLLNNKSTSSDNPLLNNKGSDTSPPGPSSTLTPSKPSELQRMLSQLGPDPSQDMMDMATFTAALRRRSIPIKAMLLDQAFLSGIGNWIADECLFQARIHPETLACALSDEDVKRLYDAIIHVIRVACEANADSSKFPADWLFHVRWGKGKGPVKTAAGHAVTFVTVGGRTSAIVTALQAGPKKTPVGRTAAGVEETSIGVAAIAASGAGDAEPAVVVTATQRRTSRGSMVEAPATADIGTTAAPVLQINAGKRKASATATRAPGSKRARRQSEGTDTKMDASAVVLNG